jgi:hypothetical protein
MPLSFRLAVPACVRFYEGWNAGAARGAAGRRPLAHNPNRLPAVLRKIIHFCA